MPIEPRKLEKILTKKFHFEPAKRSSDHRWYGLKLPNLPTIYTKVSHSRREIGPKLERMIARQIKVRMKYYRGMIDCTNDCEDYYRQVRTDPYST